MCAASLLLGVLPLLPGAVIDLCRPADVELRVEANELLVGGEDRLQAAARLRSELPREHWPASSGLLQYWSAERILLEPSIVNGDRAAVELVSRGGETAPDWFSGLALQIEDLAKGRLIAWIPLGDGRSLEGSLLACPSCRHPGAESAGAHLGVNRRVFLRPVLVMNEVIHGAGEGDRLYRLEIVGSEKLAARLNSVHGVDVRSRPTYLVLRRPQNLKQLAIVFCRQALWADELDQRLAYAELALTLDSGPRCSREILTRTLKAAERIEELKTRLAAWIARTQGPERAELIEMLLEFTAGGR